VTRVADGIGIEDESDWVVRKTEIRERGSRSREHP
jgi:hypothetical protein